MISHLYLAKLEESNGEPRRYKVRLSWAHFFVVWIGRKDGVGWNVCTRDACNTVPKSTLVAWWADAWQNKIRRHWQNACLGDFVNVEERGWGMNSWQHVRMIKNKTSTMRDGMCILRIRGTWQFCSRLVACTRCASLPAAAAPNKKRIKSITISHGDAFETNTRNETTNTLMEYYNSVSSAATATTDETPHQRMDTKSCCRSSWRARNLSASSQHKVESVQHNSSD